MFINQNYYSLIDDVPSWLQKASSQLGPEATNLEELKIIRGRDNFKNRLSAYHDTLFYNALFLIEQIVSQDDRSMAYVRMSTKFPDEIHIETNMMFYFEFIEENDQLQFINIFGVHDYLEQLIKVRIFELHQSDTIKSKELSSYIENLLTTGMIEHLKD